MADYIKKSGLFQKAYGNFDIFTISNYDDSGRARLLNDSGIIWSKLKVETVIYNLKQIVNIQCEHGSFKQWLELNSENTKAKWLKLFKKTFKFTGGEIVNEFLVSTGYLKDAHDKDCPVY